MAARYVPPTNCRRSSLSKLVEGTGRTLRPTARQKTPKKERTVFLAGEAALLRGACVSLIGSRKASTAGERRARDFAHSLAEAGIVVMSGLAAGVDTAAMTAAMEAKGHVVGVIGTPLDKAYPAANARLQERVYREHLLVSQFAPGTQVRPGNFPTRNKLMAALSDASAIIEASDGSGTLHQADECVRLGRWLFITREMADDRRRKWPAKYARYERLVVVDDALQIIERVRKT